MPSPTALRYDPPLRKRSWRVEGTSSWDGFLANARERFSDDETLARTLWHGGLLLNGRPVVVDAPPDEVAAGSWVAAWSFEREPEPVVLGRDRLLLDDERVDPGTGRTVTLDGADEIDLPRARPSAVYRLGP